MVLAFLSASSSTPSGQSVGAMSQSRHSGALGTRSAGVSCRFRVLAFVVAEVHHLGAAANVQFSAFPAVVERVVVGRRRCSHLVHAASAETLGRVDRPLTPFAALGVRFFQDIADFF